MTVIAAVLLAIIAPFPNGAYGMAELCQKLEKATGVIHQAATPLEDYPVFVSVKSGDAKQVEKLVAAALHAEWVEEKSVLKLRPIKPSDPLVGFAEWEKRAKLILGDGFRQLPLKDLYLAPCGTVFRYSDQRLRFSKVLPKAAAQKVEPDSDGVRSLVVKKMGPGSFAQSINFPERMAGLPESILKMLGENAAKVALPAEVKRAFSGDRLAIMKLATTPAKRDIVANLNAPFLTAVGDAVESDLVTVLLDKSYPVGSTTEVASTVQQLLSSYGADVDFEIIDGAIVGRMPMCERLHSTQCHRTALNWSISECKAGQLLHLSTWSEYLTRERPLANQTFCGQLLMVLAGVLLEQSHFVDYPYNLYLGMRCSPADWNLIRKKNRFFANELSGPVQEALRNLLLNSAGNLGIWDTLPFLWPSLDPSSLFIETTVKDETVLVCSDRPGGVVAPPEDAGRDFNSTSREVGGQPKYRIAVRHLVTLVVRHRDSATGIETGFGDVDFDPRSTPTNWTDLPEPYRSEFEKGFVGTPSHD